MIERIPCTKRSACRVNVSQLTETQTKGLFCCCVKKCHSLSIFFFFLVFLYEIHTNAHKHTESYVIMLSFIGLTKRLNPSKRRRLSSSHTINTPQLTISTASAATTSKTLKEEKKKRIYGASTKNMFTHCDKN